jgi:hypothetical protein
MGGSGAEPRLPSLPREAGQGQGGGPGSSAER